ncbi:MAG: serine hydrolase [Candidatus Magasanikbacteria bacterium]|nr:serine hydrolase [Candidatus Magasanikbacteria bacterium]
MTKKVFDFISSFGLMILGVGLLFAFTVSFAPAQKQCQYRFPKSHPREQFGGDLERQNLPPSRPTVPLAKNDSNFSATLTAFSAYIIDDKTDTVLFEKNAEAIRPLASITKIMSAIVLLDLPIKWNATTTVTEADCDDSSHILNSGEIFKLQDLWAAGLIGSSNSGIRSLVRVSGLTIEEFVQKMNNKAKVLNLLSLKFTDPTGLEADNVGSAKDIAALLKEALKNEKISKTMSIGEYYIKPLNKPKSRRVWSTNWLLTKWIPSDFDTKNICGKTGYIGDAKYNFAVRIADKENNPIIVVVLGSATNESRFSEARDLADWSYSKFLWPNEDGYNDLVE